MTLRNSTHLNIPKKIPECFTAIQDQYKNYKTNNNMAL